MADVVIGLLISRHMREKMLQAKAAWEKKKERIAQAEALYGRGFNAVAFTTAEKIMAELQEQGLQPALVMDDPSGEIDAKLHGEGEKENAYILRSVMIACRIFFEASEMISLGAFPQWIKDVFKSLPKSMVAENFNFMRAEGRETRAIICRAFLDGIEAFTNTRMEALPWRRYTTHHYFRRSFNIEDEGEQFEIMFPGNKLDANTLERLSVKALINAIGQEKKCFLSIR